MNENQDFSRPGRHPCQIPGSVGTMGVMESSIKFHHEIRIYQVILHSFRCFSIYDKVIECIQLKKCCLTYKHGVNVHFYNNYTC